MRTGWRAVVGATAVRAVTAMVAVAALAAPAQAAPSPAAPSLDLDAVTAGYLATAQAEVGVAAATLAQAERALAAADAASAAASATLTQAIARAAAVDAAQRQQVLGLQRVQDRLRSVAVEAYVNGGAADQVAAVMGAQSIAEFGRRRGVLDGVMKQEASAIADYRRARAAADASTRRLADAVRQATDARDAAARQAAQAAFAAQGARAALSDRQGLLALINGALPAGGTDIPTIVMDAYRRASTAVTARGCPLAWWALAGVGEIESHHGRHHHVTLSANGDLLPPILGPALDGTNGTQAIPAADGGRYTGDPTWDHAVGPMQFITSTWRRWGVDGNGDGVANPNNVYDASLATADYLCAASGDVQTDAGLRAAFYSYNHSDAYVSEVLMFAHLYRDSEPHRP